MAPSEQMKALASENTTIKAQKRPPPEKPANQRTRSLVILSFWAVAVLLGIPVWIWTTSIHRETLPLEEMSSWAEGKACKPSLPIQIDIQASSLPEAEASHLIQLTQHALDDHNEFSAHHLRLQMNKNRRALPGSSKSPQTQDKSGIGAQEAKTEDIKTALTVHLIPDISAQSVETLVDQHRSVLDIRYPPSYVPSISASTSSFANMLAGELQEMFSEERAIVEYTLAQPQLTGSQSPGNGKDAKSNPLKTLSAEIIANLASRSTRSFKYASHFHITFSLFTPHASPSAWEIEHAIKDEFAPLLDALSVVSNFSVDTQVQLYAKFSPSTPAPEFDSTSGKWTLRQEDLSSFINAAEWPLSPSVGTGPTLNFVVYVPDSASTPLVVKESLATHWLIPQWGGLVILNDFNSTATSKILKKEQIQSALHIFAHQLLSLLGAPASAPSLPLQLQTLIRVQAISLLLSASSTMRSLARLTVKLPSIAIPETVSQAVDTTLLELRKTCTALKDGEFHTALAHARVAEEHAEKGFFEKSMVGQVYFPDEHKVAVYLPLLGPVGVPLLMSGIKEVKKILAARRAQ